MSTSSNCITLHLYAQCSCKTFTDWTASKKSYNGICS